MYTWLVHSILSGVIIEGAEHNCFLCVVAEIYFSQRHNESHCSKGCININLPTC